MTRLLLGAAIGAIIGVLFAPRRGEETREDLKRRLAEMQGMHDPSGMHGHDFEARGRDFANQTGDKIRQRLDEARAKVVQLVRNVEEDVETAAQQRTGTDDSDTTSTASETSTSTEESSTTVDTSGEPGAKGTP